MAYTSNILPIVLNGTGTEVPALNISDAYDLYVFSGTAIAIGNYTIVPTGTPQIGTTFKFENNSTLDITTNGTTFSLFGKSITQAQLLKYWVATCVYNGSSWNVDLELSLTQSGVISSNNIGSSTIVNSNIANSTIDASTKLVNLSVTTAKINDLAVTTAKIDDLAVTSAKLAADSVTTAKILDDNVTNSKLAEMANNTVKANISGRTANPSDVNVCTLVSNCAWSLTGNSGTTPGTNFLGTTDNQDLVFKANNLICGRINLSESNTSFGRESLLNHSGGIYNCAFGRNSLNATTSGDHNTGLGSNSLMSNTTGSNNTSVGSANMTNCLSGSYNTSVGYGSFQGISTGTYNTALGHSVGSTLSTGARNTLIGTLTEVSSSNSVNRIALGYGANADADYQFAIPSDVTHLNFPLNTHTNGAILTTDSNGYGVWNVPNINTTAGDSATIDAISGRFRKDTSGTTFTLTNSFINVNSVILLTMVQLDATATRAVVSAGSGSATITFDAAPTSNLDVNFLVIN